METFTEPKALIENPQYRDQRQRNLASLDDNLIDRPIIGLINAFKELPYCFTIQSCYGHFVYNGQDDPRNLEPLPLTNTIYEVEYRIAYIAFCIENNYMGKKFLRSLKEIESIDTENIQFCCAEWFWKRQSNSFALQVEPDRFKHKDTAILDYKEALYVEKVRNEFYDRLYKLLGRLKGR